VVLEQRFLSLEKMMANLDGKKLRRKEKNFVSFTNNPLRS
jgi:hypothetical protein